MKKIKSDLKIKDIIIDSSTGELKKIKKLVDIIKNNYNGKEDYRCLILSDTVLDNKSISNYINQIISENIIDFICITGDNIYYDIANGLKIGKEEENIHSIDKRIDVFIRNTIEKGDFPEKMSGTELNYILGSYLYNRDKKAECLLVNCYKNHIPVFNVSPGASLFGLNKAELNLRGIRRTIDPSNNINEFSSLLWKIFNTKKNLLIISIGEGFGTKFIDYSLNYIKSILNFTLKGIKTEQIIINSNKNDDNNINLPPEIGILLLFSQIIDEIKVKNKEIYKKLKNILYEFQKEYIKREYPGKAKE